MPAFAPGKLIQRIPNPQLSLIGGDYSYDGPNDLFASAAWNLSLVNKEIRTEFSNGGSNGNAFHEFWVSGDISEITYEVRLDQVSGDAPDLAGVLLALATWYDLDSSGAYWALFVGDPETADFTFRIREKGIPTSEINNRYDLSATF